MAANLHPESSHGADRIGSFFMHSFQSPHGRWRACTLSTLIVALIGYADIVTGTQLSLSVFYIFPVFLAAWFVGRAAGCIAAILCAAVWLVGEYVGDATYSHPLIACWNAIGRAISFLVIALTLPPLKSLTTRLEVLVSQRTAALRDLATQLAEAEDNERRRLAHDMHDGLGQQLLLLKLGLESALAKTSNDDEHQRRLRESIELLNATLRQTRTLMFDLHPPVLDDLGFVPALRQYADVFAQQTQADVTVTEIGTPRAPARSLVSHLFRAVKELLNNAVTHGHAREILLSIHWEPASLRLVVDDDGDGFDTTVPRRPTGRGLGLAGIRERSGSLGGAFRIESQPGQGTRAVLEVPLKTPDTADALT